VLRIVVRGKSIPSILSVVLQFPAGWRIHGGAHGDSMSVGILEGGQDGHDEKDPVSEVVVPPDWLGALASEITVVDFG